MEIIILIPFFACVYSLYRSSPQRTFLNVYLPVFMLLPTYYFWKVAALPPLDFGEVTLLPLGIGMLFVDLPRWRFSRSDVWMGVFLFTAYYADHAAGNQSVATFELFAAICNALIPYMAGKLLIEQYDARVETLKRIVFLLFVASIISAYEYRMAQNPFSLVLGRFFPNEFFAWKTQIRWGFGRVSGPFAQSELAGIIWAFGLVLALYLGYLKHWEPKFLRIPWLPFKKATIITCTLAFTLLMTQARGPWLGCLVAIPIAFIGRSKHVLRTALIVGIVGGIAGYGGYRALKAYTSGPVSSESQESAAYRATLVTNYMPIVEKGGWLGWGKDFPTVPNQASVDNAYLYLALTQGYLGLGALVLLAVESFLELLKPAVFGGVVHYRYFAFSMTGILIGLLMVLGTVFLGGQPYQLFFLLVGWSQSLEPRIGELREPERTFQAVYT